VKNFVKIIFILLFVNSLFSWTNKTHSYIGEIIYSSLPPEYQRIIDKEEFLTGCVAPDKKEYKSIFPWYHVYHPETSWGSLPTGCEELYKQTLSLFKLEKKKQASFLLGGLVHYISDVCIPLHTAQESWETNETHQQIEKEAEDYMFKYQPKKEKIFNIYTYAVELAKSSYKNYDGLREKSRRPEILKQQFVLACDSSYSVVYDVLQQILSVPSQTQQVVVSTSSVDYEAEISVPLSSSRKFAGLVQSLRSNKPNKPSNPTNSIKPVVRVMGVILSPDKEYHLKLVPDGSGNFYLDIWEEKE
jgi:hypothetical protein